ncbi:hypothetical protein TARUN_4729 [Trichoderma arundinaceum]|uniref:Uncharacterized protein n=1 Tax=Trichoderma arundinaceum TaxID=490622 RepID=A0A395NN55_TRIAR|nr:hypothetical protein TARUN_4729 [Trichoderma arundinaceum]
MSSPSSCRTYSLDSISTKPSSRGSSPAVQKESSSSSRGRTRRNAKHVTPCWNLMFHPRSYEEIYAERAYLTSSLQMYSIKAVELIHQYSLIEEELQAKDHIGKQRRKLGKQMSFIKVKLSEASRQEKAIIIRLSELQMEQLGRDTWEQVQQRRMFYASLSSGAVMPPSTSPETPLNASSMEFVPSDAHKQHTMPEMERYNVLDTVVEAKEGEEDGNEAPKDNGDKVGTRQKIDNVSEDLCNHGLEYTYQVYGDAENPQPLPSHIRERVSSCSEEKRRSLPNLCSLWPGV